MDRLFIWLSPAFPVGAFAYSHGLEWAYHAGLVGDATTLQDWLEDLVTRGSWHNDAILFALAHGLIMRRDRSGYQGLCALALALSASRERHQETIQQGNAMLIAARASWPCESLELTEGDTPYPLALAILTAGHGLTREQVLLPYGLAFVQNLVSASIRLGIIGQTAGQNILAALVPTVTTQAQKASDATLDDLANTAFMADFASLQHETIDTRIFRS